MLLLKIRNRLKNIRQRIYTLNDLRMYARSLAPLRRIARHLPTDKGSLLIVSGRGMNVVWGQIWPVFSLGIRMRGYRGLVLTTRTQKLLNRYYRLLKLELIYLEDWMDRADMEIPAEIEKKMTDASDFETFRALHYRDAPVGQIALSTYSRYHGTGVVNVANPEVRSSVLHWCHCILRSMAVAERVFQQYNVRILFFTEVFMEEYGGLYYTALAQNLNIIRFAGSVRDTAKVMQHLSRANDRLHHSSLSASSWATLKALPWTPEHEVALAQNFRDRYGDRWHLSRRNQSRARQVVAMDVRRVLGLQPGRKTAIIFSHILYDTLFFFGTDLFKDYAEWLIETVRAAVANPDLDWFIKVHPSNIWRGELGSLLKGRYEEERLIEDRIGPLPPHVRIVPADTDISPVSWMHMADYGITVRGTSGLEMAAMGKAVVTAGTGRYEGRGFTADPSTIEAYLEVLRTLHEMPLPQEEAILLAKQYAYAIFLLKPFEMTSLIPRLATGKERVVASDDLLYSVRPMSESRLPEDISRFTDWAMDAGMVDLLNDWNAPLIDRQDKALVNGERETTS
jgi:hypothetical protein